MFILAASEVQSDDLSARNAKYKYLLALWGAIYIVFVAYAYEILLMTAYEAPGRKINLQTVVSVGSTNAESVSETYQSNLPTTFDGASTNSRFNYTRTAAPSGIFRPLLIPTSNFESTDDGTI